jgi:hypothetical protein
MGRPRKKNLQQQQTEAVLEQVYDWVLKGNSKIPFIRQIIEIFIDVFGETAYSENWKARGIAAQGETTYLELALTLKLLVVITGGLTPYTKVKSLDIKFMIPYQSIDSSESQTIGVVLFDKPTDLPTHWYWHETHPLVSVAPAPRERLEIEENTTDLVGLVSLTKNYMVNPWV